MDMGIRNIIQIVMLTEFIVDCVSFSASFIDATQNWCLNNEQMHMPMNKVVARRQGTLNATWSIA